MRGNQRVPMVPVSLRLRKKRLFSALALLLVAPWLGAQVEPPPRFETYSDFGGVGLLQMPSARFAPEGTVAFSMTRVAPYIRNALTVQPLPWLEGVLRYTTVENRLYGPIAFSGNQSLKDKGLDIKLRLLEESSVFPQLVVGVRDIGGTGLFSSEYLALSRRYYDFDFTLGMGWGYLGNRGQLANPLGFMSDRFKQRVKAVGQGGALSTTSYFRGEQVSLFGGVVYQTPLPGLALRLEYDGNDYQSEPSANNQPVFSPLNVAATYSYSDWLDVSVGWERGNALMAQLAVRGDIHKVAGLPKFDPPPSAIKPRDLSAEVAAMAQAKRDEKIGDPGLRLVDALTAHSYKVDSVEIKGKRAIATVSQRTFRNKAKALGRAVRVMANELPADVEALTYVSLEKGLETQRVTLLRTDLEKAVRYEGSPEEMAVHAVIEPPLTGSAENPRLNLDRYPSLSWGGSPAMRHQIGGPDEPYFYQIFLRLDGEVQLSRKLSLTGEVGFNLTDNLDKLKVNSDSVLPHVRSDIKEYLKQGKTGISRLQLDYLTNLSSSWFGRLSGGLFEDMFAGIGGEILYKPFDQPWALGLDLNRVRQRGYDKGFGLLDYEVTTGHLDFYYKLPFYNLTAQLSAGQYLAGDRGVTIALSRQFDSGAVVGVFATKTNISAEQFGEGSFDKGAYISVPIDLLSFYSSRSTFGMGWRPLTRDGGQRLAVGKRLYPIVADSDPGSLLKDWGRILD